MRPVAPRVSCGVTRRPRPHATREPRTGDGELGARIARIAADPPGGVPAGWRLARLDVSGGYQPERGEWWQAAAEYVHDAGSGETGRLIGAGPTVRAALVALAHRLGDPLEERRRRTGAGWDPADRPGRTLGGP